MPSTEFQQAVEMTEHLDGAFCSGFQALAKSHRTKVHLAARSRAIGSVNLDQALARVSAHKNAPRWDYGLGYKNARGMETAVWIEVHPAATSDVSTILKKFAWLKEWLSHEGGRLDALTNRDQPRSAFLWMATKGVHIRPGTPQDRRLRQAGLDRPKSSVTLA